MLAVLSGSFILPDQPFSHIQMASVTFPLLINGKFLYSAVSNPPDCSKQFTLYSLADLFNQTPSQLLWEASSHAAINAQTLFIHKYPPMSITRYSFTQLSELEHRRVKNLPNV